MLDKVMLKLCIHSNESYCAGDVRDRNRLITVAELRDMLEGYPDDMQIVTYDLNNSRGAAWGSIDAEEWVEEVTARDE